MKKTSLVYSIIKTVGMAGMVGVVVVAPNSAQALDAVAQLSRKRKSSKAYLDYLKRSEYFEIGKTGTNSFVIRLSAKGDKAYSGIDFKDYVKPTKKWDGNWHLLMFDVPERHKSIRNHINRELHSVGLKPIQDSVFVYPYDLSVLASAIREEYPRVSGIIISAKISRIDGEKQLKNVFRSII